MCSHIFLAFPSARSLDKLSEVSESSCDQISAELNQMYPGVSGGLLSRSSTFRQPTQLTPVKDKHSDEEEVEKAVGQVGWLQDLLALRCTILTALCMLSSVAFFCRPPE